jgi:hypothetical protein
MVSFTDTLPARGPRGCVLQVKDLAISDARTSNILINIVSHIESITGTQVKKETVYDD